LRKARIWLRDRIQNNIRMVVTHTKRSRTGPSHKVLTYVNDKNDEEKSMLMFARGHPDRAWNLRNQMRFRICSPMASPSRVPDTTRLFAL
jgi:hypothetical protein